MIPILRTGLILHTARYDECVKFYRDIIGLRVEFERNEPDQVLTCLTFGQAYLMIEGGGVATASVKTPRENPVTIRLNVVNAEAAASVLREKGLNVSVARYSWGAIARFHDPDGNPCQLREQAGFGP